jgi:hypothetical protein
MNFFIIQVSFFFVHFFFECFVGFSYFFYIFFVIVLVFSKLDFLLEVVVAFLFKIVKRYIRKKNVNIQ